MAKLSFSDLQTKSSEPMGGGNYQNSVNFFTLKNDGDEAIVRFLHNSTSDFDIYAVHSVDTPQERKKFHNVNCLRGMNGAVEECPFCAAGMRFSNKIFIHLIQYVTNDQGQIEARPMIWERAIPYAYTLKGYLEEYGPLPNYIFKIKRSGAPGSRDTTYNITFANQAAYPIEKYPIVMDAFNNYNALGHALEKCTPQDMIFFLENKTFPQPVPKTEQAPAQQPQQQFTPPTQEQTPNYGSTAAYYAPPTTPQFTHQAPMQPPVNNTQEAPKFHPTPTPPWEQASQTPARPQRYY